MSPREATPYEIMRPFAWLAVLAFVVGFLGQVLLSHPGAARAPDRPTIEETVSGPASAEWNLPHHI